MILAGTDGMAPEQVAALRERIEAEESARHAACEHTTGTGVAQAVILDAVRVPQAIQTQDSAGQHVTVDGVTVTVCLDQASHCRVGCGLDRQFTVPAVTEGVGGWLTRTADQIAAELAQLASLDRQRDVAPPAVPNLVGRKL